MIFMTGGTGILGMRLAYDLLTSGHKLRMLCRPDTDKTLFRAVINFYHQADVSSLMTQLEWAEGDVMDIQSISEHLRGCVQCIHAAAMVSFHWRDEDAMMKVNIEGTANVVNACLIAEQSPRLLYISSVAALGREDQTATINEAGLWKDSPYNTAYAVSKYHAEMEVWRGIEEGLSAVMINPSIILGAGSPTRSSGTLYGAVQNGLMFYTDGGASLVDARDVSAIGLKLLASEVSGERYVLASGTIPYQQMFDVIAQKLGKKKPTYRAGAGLLAVGWRLAWLKDRVLGGRSPITRETALSSQSSYDYDSSKIRSLLEYEFRTVEESLAYYAAYYSTGFKSP